MLSNDIRILHVDDDSDRAELVATFLEREDDRFDVETASGATEGLDHLAENDVHCIVSDYDMPGRNGIEFLEAVREEYPDIPFILYTGKGSEEIASEAISAGVTDYLQKESDPSQYAVLANRISNTVEGTRSAIKAEHRRHRLEQILKTVPGCVVQLDVEGHFVFANQRAEAVLGLETAELTDRAYNDPEWDIRDLNGDPMPDEALPFRRVRDTGEPLYGARHTIKWPDGTRKVLLVNGAPLFDEEGAVESVVFSITDITDQYEQEHELERRQEQFQYVEEIADIGYWEVDLRTPGAPEPTGSQGAFDIYERQSDEPLAPDQALEYYHPEDRPKIERAFDRLVFDGQSYDLELRLTTEAGNDRWVHTVGNPVKHEGEIVKVRGIIQDITERKQQEQALADQNERLDRFASIVSHDLRNPLSVAHGRLELTQADCDSEHLDPMKKALERMERIIDDVLWLAREGLDIGETEPVMLRDVIENAWTIVAAETESAELTYSENEFGSDAVEADDDRFQQLLENLIRNAVEHGGEEVTVTVGRLNDGFYLEDDGPGIPAEDRDNVFEAGYSTSAQGTGFGLNIVKQIVDAHDWEIRITNGSEGGARFEITGVEFVE